MFKCKTQLIISFGPIVIVFQRDLWWWSKRQMSSFMQHLSIFQSFNFYNTLGWKCSLKNNCAILAQAQAILAQGLIASAWWVRCTLGVSSFRISSKTRSHAAQRMEHRSGTGRLVATHPRSTSTIRKVADEGSAEVQREGSGNSSSRFSSWSASPWSSAWSTTRGGAFQCKGPRDQIGGGNGSSRRVRPYVRRVARRFEESQSAGSKYVPSQDRIASSKVFIERRREDPHWSRRSFSGSGGIGRQHRQSWNPKSKGWLTRRHDWPPSSWRSPMGLQRLHQQSLPTSRRSWPSCVLVSSSCRGKTPISVLNCNSKVKVAKNGTGNIREIYQVRHSIWHLYTAITVAQRCARDRVRPCFKDCPSHLSGWRH